MPDKIQAGRDGEVPLMSSFRVGLAFSRTLGVRRPAKDAMLYA